MPTSGLRDTTDTFWLVYQKSNEVRQPSLRWDESTKPAYQCLHTPVVLLISSLHIFLTWIKIILTSHTDSLMLVLTVPSPQYKLPNHFLAHHKSTINRPAQARIAELAWTGQLSNPHTLYVLADFTMNKKQLHPELFKLLLSNGKSYINLMTVPCNKLHNVKNSFAPNYHKICALLLQRHHEIEVSGFDT